MLLRLIELLMYVVLLLGTVSQVAIPLWKNRPTFPLFRKKTKVESQFGKAVEQQEVNELVNRMRNLRNREP